MLKSLPRLVRLPEPAAAPSPPWQTLYDDQIGFVFNSLRRLGVRGSDLDDLSQETFMRAFRQLDLYDPTRPVRPWLFGIAFRVVAEFKRRARPAADLDDLAELELEDEAAGPEAAFEAAEARAQVLFALAELKLAPRAIFIMHELEGYSIPEVSETLGMPLNTCYARLRKARQHFSAVVQRVRSSGNSP